MSVIPSSSNEALSAAGPPQGANAPLGGSAVRAATSVGAFIFDMDGTMIDSMPTHQRSWVEFTRRHGLEIDVADLMRRTTGRTGVECMLALFEGKISIAQAQAFVDEKEQMYRDLFAPIFKEIAGFKTFLSSAQSRGLALGVGTAGDRHNQAFAYQHLALGQPLPTVGGDEGLPGKPEPAIFLEVARRLGVSPQRCIVFEDAPLGIEAARRAGMRAVAICSSHPAHELDGPHVIARVPDYHTLTHSRFLETHHVLVP